jgi:Protein of unknown function (DUF3014)
VSDLYFRFQPLFQRAYEELTKSDGRFDDRVLQAIDGLIDAPEIRDPVLVVRREACAPCANRSSPAARPDAAAPR